MRRQFAALFAGEHTRGGDLRDNHQSSGAALRALAD